MPTGRDQVGDADRAQGGTRLEMPTGRDQVKQSSRFNVSTLVPRPLLLALVQPLPKIGGLGRIGASLLAWLAQQRESTPVDTNWWRHAQPTSHL